ncbi:heme/copper-type cytochrome/quinol oxidase subunit 2 [Mycobacterium frederiksbergense]|uniref:Heme/copper-type cytochrome/quinol oxidase subunit 2 n=1 Tax=Mycolicibacterium frederiksbergense TaxID=117567 RepID=A0ABT6L7U4_9MYCO|nr:hypothetical protein [Mycolicibacterium frederiksbergense]MDH6199028.1 heme/copper-type cytochrome/quinol oxidase subunit 2 [Mycolicibacterium frederiksbergense]
MVTNQSPKQLLATVGLIATGVIAGLVLYLWLVLMLALVGFYTVSFGTAAFVALLISVVLVATSVITGRRRGPDEAAPRRLSLFLRSILVAHVAICIFAAVFMPETVLFLPHR